MDAVRSSCEATVAPAAAVGPEGGGGTRLDDATFRAAVDYGPSEYGPWAVWCYEAAGEATIQRRRLGRRLETEEDLEMDALVLLKRAFPGATMVGELDAINCTDATPAVDPEPVVKDPERSKRSAANRATVKVRRYCVAHRLTRQVTLTYRGEGVHDEEVVGRDVKLALKRLKRRGVDLGPYLWVRELHPGGHGFHVHLLLGKYVPKVDLERAWGLGFVDVRKIKTKHSGGRADARTAASYLAKYVRKTFEEGGTVSTGRHRYGCARGYQVVCRSWVAMSTAQAIGQCAKIFYGEAPAVVFWNTQEGASPSDAPPTAVAFWS
jgi:hypothetical protein